mgnify:CR=1 FL=1
MMTPDGCVIVLTLLSAPLVFVGEGAPSVLEAAARLSNLASR